MLVDSSGRSCSSLFSMLPSLSLPAFSARAFRFRVSTLRHGLNLRGPGWWMPVGVALHGETLCLYFLHFSAFGLRGAGQRGRSTPKGAFVWVCLVGSSSPPVFFFPLVFQLGSCRFGFRSLCFPWGITTTVSFGSWRVGAFANRRTVPKSGQ